MVALTAEERRKREQQFLEDQRRPTAALLEKGPEGLAPGEQAYGEPGLESGTQRMRREQIEREAAPASGTGRVPRAVTPMMAGAAPAAAPAAQAEPPKPRAVADFMPTTTPAAAPAAQAEPKPRMLTNKNITNEMRTAGGTPFPSVEKSREVQEAQASLRDAQRLAERRKAGDIITPPRTGAAFAPSGGGQAAQNLIDEAKMLYGSASRSGVPMARRVGMMKEAKALMEQAGLQTSEAGDTQRTAMGEAGATQRSGMDFIQAQMDREQETALARMDAGAKAKRDAALNKVETGGGKNRDPTKAFADLVKVYGESVDPDQASEYAMRDLQKLGYDVGGKAAPTAAGPAVGTESNGYRFTGGNPKDKENWEKI